MGGETIRASMGPPIFIGGNCPPLAAKAPLQGASMGPPIFIGGNAPTAGRPKRDQTASMGPPIFIGGNGLSPGYVCDLVRASMGPPIFIGGNEICGCGAHREINLLQWGRRFSSAETLLGRDMLHRDRLRFNGAADFHRRKLDNLWITCG